MKHYKIEFENGEPHQCMPSKETNFTRQEQEVIDMEIDKLLIKRVISETTHCRGEYMHFYNICMPQEIKDGGHRLILNLKSLNEHVEYHHFKMDTLQSAIRLMTPNCYMASADLRDAYYSVPIHIDDQKYLRFCWKGRLFQFTCLPKLMVWLLHPDFSQKFLSRCMLCCARKVI